MRRVVVKKRKVEKDFGILKLVYMICEIIETVKWEDGTIERRFREQWQVVDIWDLEEMNEVYS